MHRTFLVAGVLVAFPAIASAQVTGEYSGSVSGVHSMNGVSMPMEANVSLRANFSTGVVEGTVHGFHIIDQDEYGSLVIDIQETPILQDLRISSVSRNLKSGSVGESSTFGQWNLSGNLAGKFQKTHTERVPKYLTGYFRAEDTLDHLHWVLAGIFLAELME